MQLLQKFEVISEYLGGQPSPPMHTYFDEVAKQARPHTARMLPGELTELIKRRRPNESEVIQDYRADNRRQITREVFENFFAALSRVMRGGNIEIKAESKALKDWLDKSKFTYNGKNYSLLNYAFECLTPEALRNPNQILIAFPYGPENPTIPPSFPLSEGGHDPNTVISIKPMVVNHKEIAYVDSDVLVFQGGHRTIKVGNAEQSHPFYYAADSESWYLLEPRVKKSPASLKDTGRTLKVSNNLEYEPILWYIHNTGESLVNFLPGETQKTEKGFFLESFLRPAFEIGDEVLMRFSDEQSISTRFAHPITVAHPVDCTAPGCNGGYVPSDDGPVACSVCHGKGKVPMPGPYEIYQMPEGGLFDGDNQIKDPVRFIHLPAEVGDSAFEKWNTLKVDMKRSIGLDLLEGTANESGEAKQRRLEKLQDRLNRIAISIFDGTLNNFLYQVESLLVKDEGRRKRAAISYPKYFKLDSVEELKEAAETALSEDRFAKKMAYYNEQYRSDPEMVRIKELAMSYAPLLLLTEDERVDAINKGVYADDDLIKAYNAEIALSKLSAKGELPEDEKEVFKMVDEYLIDRGFLVQRDIQEIAEEVQKSPLLQTVGGVQGIVAISQAVADGSMTEGAAERLLVEVFGFSPSVAASLIESPVQDPPTLPDVPVS
ncbi:MAG: hypothetical protein ACWA44_02440 [Thiotrichales bacterium]